MLAIDRTRRATAGGAAVRGTMATAVPTRRLALPVVLYMWALVLPIGFYIGPLYLNLVRIVLLVMIVPLTARLISGRLGRLLWPDLLFLLHVIWIIIAIRVNDPDRAVQYVGSTVIEFIGSYVLARAYIRTTEDFIDMVRLLVLLIVLTLPLALVELRSNVPPILALLQRIPGIRTEWIVQNSDEMRMGLYRVQAVFAHPIHYGMFCTAGLALCLVGLTGVFGTAKRYAATLVVVLCALSSLSSGALLPVFLQLGLIAWAWAFAGVRARWLILALLFVAAYLLVAALSNRPPLMVFLSFATFSAWNAYWRSYIFEFGMNNVYAHPWFGIGLTADWVRPSWMGPASVDNFWLVVAMRYGFPGIITLLLGYLPSLWAVAMRPLTEGSAMWRLRRAWMIVMTGLTLALATVDVWSTLFSFVFFLFGAGMWFLTGQSEEGATPLPRPRGRPPHSRFAPRSRQNGQTTSALKAVQT